MKKFYGETMSEKRRQRDSENEYMTSVIENKLIEGN